MNQQIYQHVAGATPHERPASKRKERCEPAVALLTGGRDKPYALGLASALLSVGIAFDFIGSDLVDGPELHNNPLVRFLKMRDQQLQANLAAKVFRILRYYARLVRYAAVAQPFVFHLLWNNKSEFVDRTLLMLYYRLLGKKIALTVHNVNAGKRDGTDSPWNRLTLRVQYRLTHHLFVHTEKMRQELVRDFAIAESKVTVIPFGINNTVPNTDLSPADAKRQLGLAEQEKTILFFGNIAPYKGLEFLVAAFEQLPAAEPGYRLVIAGSPKWTDEYWLKVKSLVDRSKVRDRIVQHIEYIPDEKTEMYFKAADLLVLPYTHVFQSGVLFLGYSFGLPAVATNVGSLKEEIIESETGFLCQACDAGSLARVIQRYFESDLFRDLEWRRAAIRQYANDRYSWAKVAALTLEVYQRLLPVSSSCADHVRISTRARNI
jgi:glycosyltransferase involved in cell wall biosynthesis